MRSTMHAHLWEYPSGALTDAYHDGGSVLIIAPSVDAARAMWREEADLYDGPARATLDETPDRIWPLATEFQSEVFIFPDAGCC